MNISLDNIYPSPFNPKYGFSKKQLNALELSIKRYGFIGSLIVCHNFDGDGYYCLDGNSRLEILKKQNIKEVDCKIIDAINNQNDLEKFVAIYDNIKKKYKLSELHKDNLINDEIIEKLNLKLDLFKVKVSDIKLDESVNQLQQFFLTLDSNTCKKLRRKFIRKTFREKEDELIIKLENKTDDEILKFLLS